MAIKVIDTYTTKVDAKLVLRSGKDASVLIKSDDPEELSERMQWHNCTGLAKLGQQSLIDLLSTGETRTLRIVLSRSADSTNPNTGEDQENWFISDYRDISELDDKALVESRVPKKRSFGSKEKTTEPVASPKPEKDIIFQSVPVASSKKPELQPA